MSSTWLVWFGILNDFPLDFKIEVSVLNVPNFSAQRSGILWVPILKISVMLLALRIHQVLGISGRKFNLG